MNPAHLLSRSMLCLALVTALPSVVAAQDADDANGLIVGASVGQFHEAWEGNSEALPSGPG